MQVKCGIWLNESRNLSLTQGPSLKWHIIFNINIFMNSFNEFLQVYCGSITTLLTYVLLNVLNLMHCFSVYLQVTLFWSRIPTQTWFLMLSCTDLVCCFNIPFGEAAYSSTLPTNMIPLAALPTVLKNEGLFTTYILLNLLKHCFNVSLQVTLFWSQSTHNLHRHGS